MMCIMVIDLWQHWTLKKFEIIFKAKLTSLKLYYMNIPQLLSYLWNCTKKLFHYCQLFYNNLSLTKVADFLNSASHQSMSFNWNSHISSLQTLKMSVEMIWKDTNWLIELLFFFRSNKEHDRSDKLEIIK